MNWLDPFFLIVGAVAMTLVIVGGVLLRFPPRQINPMFGYRTPTSMRSQARWDFAQRYSARLFVQAGLIGAAVSLVGVVVNWSVTTAGIAATLAVVAMVGLPIVMTEWALRKRFRDQ
ncbi:MAG: SdpI family protein [Hyphomicrobiales bacterium]